MITGTVMSPAAAGLSKRSQGTLIVKHMLTSVRLFRLRLDVSGVNDYKATDYVM